MNAINQQIVELCIGRILHMGSRPEQPGDAADYLLCRNMVMDILDDPSQPFVDVRPNWVRDRLKGAQGD